MVETGRGIFGSASKTPVAMQKPNTYSKTLNFSKKAFRDNLKILLAFLFLPGLVVGQRVYEDTTAILCGVTNGASGTMSIANPWVSVAGDAELVFYYQGDLNSSSENYELRDESGTLLITGSDPSQCNSNLASDTITVSKNDVLSWVSDGQIDFTLISSGAVDDICGGGSCAKVKISYPSKSVPDDAGIAAGIRIAERVCAGTQSVQAVLTNYGNQSLTSATVNWEVNGVAKPAYSFNGSLDTIGSGANRDTLTLGSVTLAAGQTYQFKIWTSQPNGVSDTVNGNDTLRYTVYAGLQGMYTIGGTSPDYATWTQAAQVLSQQGICGPVTFTVRPGTYTEQITLDSIPGTSPQDTVTFMSQGMDSAQVTLSYMATSTDNYLIKLNGADHLRFVGFTFHPLDNSNTRSFLWEGDISDVLIGRSQFVGPPGSGFSSNQIHIYGNNMIQADSIFLIQNTFRRGNGALLLESQSRLGNQLVFSGNQVLYPTENAVYVEGVRQVSILDNTLEYNSASDSFLSAIELENCDSSLSVAQNIIRGVEGGYGIYIDGSDASSASIGLLANNFVQIGSGSNNATGIYMYSSEFQYVVHNTVHVSSQSSSNEAADIQYGANNVLLNNNLVTDQGKALLVSGSNVFQQINHNNYYSPSPTWAEYDNTPIADLATLRAESQGDAQSIHQPAFFKNDSSWEVTQVSLNNAGTPLPYVAQDIEGDSRSASTPDMGADEFTPPASDAGIVELVVPSVPFAPGSYPVKAVLKNFGASALTSATVNWDYKGQAQPGVSFSGSLASGDTTLVTLGSVSFTTGDSAFFTAYPSSPNGSSDPNAINDTSQAGPFAAGLGGPYTIGGSSPDFPDFSSAVAALELGGAYQSVHFAVRSGTYQEQIALDSFPKAQLSDTVRFYGEAGDSTAAVLTTSSATFDQPATLELNDVNRVIFEDMTLQNLSSGYRKAIQLGKSLQHIRFSRMVVENNATSSTFTNASLLYGGDMEDVEDLVLEQLQFYNGSEALYLDGGFPEPRGVLVKNCRFEDFYESGIYLRDMDSLQVAGNYLETSSGANYSQGIYISDVWELTLEGNQVLGGTLLESGIYLNDIYGNGSGDSNLVANNMVSLGGSQAENGMYAYDINYTEFSYNSVWFYGSASAGEAFYYGYSGFANQFYNNIFQNTGGGYAVYAATSSGWSQSDHNNLHSTGPQLAYWSGDQADLAAWQTASGQGANSLSQSAQFLDTNDLHTANVNLNAAGIPRPQISVDIDGQVRDASTPDIGADEFSIAADDAGLLAIQSPVQPFAARTTAVKVKLLNNGAATLDSVNLYWTLNGQPQDTTTWYGSLASGNSLDSVVVGSLNAQAGQAYRLKIFVGQPNGNTDANPINDTLYSDSLTPALQGYYTIGSSGADFPSIGAADTALQRGGVAGWVSFGLQPGTYTEKVVLEDVLGASATDTITFRAANGDSSSVTWTATGTSGDNYVLFLNDAHHYRFKDLSLYNSDPSYGRVMIVDSGSSHLSFIGVDISSGLSGGFGSFDALVDVRDDFVQGNLSWTGCTFRNGSYGIFLDGQYNSNNLVSDNSIQNSRFLYQGEQGLFAGYQDGILIEENTFHGDQSDYTGIELEDSRSFSLTANRVFVENGYGISLDNPQVGTDSNRVVNNLVVLSGGNARYGLRLYSAEKTSLAFNTVRMHTTSSTSRAFEDSYNSSSVRIVNNIFHHHEGGLAMDVLSSSSNGITNYNSYYTTGANLVDYDGTLVPDLAGLQAQTGEDARSLQTDPGFQDSTSAQMTSATLDEAALPLAAVTTDITGANRAAKPDIGAREYTPPANDVALEAIVGPTKPFASGNTTVYLRARNNGADTLRSFTVNWAVNGTSQTAYNWSGNLASGQSIDSLPIGTYSFQPASYHQVQAVGSLPNGQPDARPENDTTLIDSLYPALSGGYIIGATNADFANFTEAARALERGGMLGSVLFNVQDGTYQEHISLGNISGNSAQDTLVFQSISQDSAKVTLENSTNNTLFTLNGPSHVTFQDLTFRHSGGQLLMVKGNSEHIRIRRVHFQQSPSATSSGHVGLTLGSGNAHDSIRVIRSHFEYGGYGLEAIAPWNVRSKGLVVRSSRFSQQQYGAIRLEGFDQSLIKNNSIHNDDNYNTSYEGLELIDLNGLNLTGNQVVARGGERAMFFYDVDGTSGTPVLVANNFAASLDSSNNGGYAIEIDNSNHLNFYHNSVLHGNGPSYGGGEALRLETNSDLQVTNNIIAAYGSGYALRVYNTTQFTELDQNVYYRAGLPPITDGSDYTLSAWRTYSGFDVNSLIYNPLFSSFSDLHIRQSAIDSAGTPLASVPKDIDGQPRSATHPDPGADEVTLFPDDLAVTALITPTSDCNQPDSTQVELAIRNSGSSTQSNFELATAVGGDTLRYTYTGSLAGGQMDTVTLSGKFYIGSINPYDFLSWVSAPTDVNTANDTFREIIFHYASPQLGITEDTTICRGSTARLQASGGSNYQWSTGQQGTFILVQPDSTKTYAVTLTNVNGCQVTDSVTVTVDQPIDTASLIVSGPTVICGGDSVLLVSTNDQNIIWSNGRTEDSIYVKTPGTYRLLLDDPGSQCDRKELGSVGVGLSIDSIQVAGNGQRTVCAGDPVVLTTDHWTSGAWGNGDTTSSITIRPQNDTMVSATWTNGLGCTFSDVILINTLPASPPSVPGNLFPADSSLGLSTPVSLSWAPANNATRYDVYYWEAGTGRPNFAQKNNLSNIQSSIGNLNPNKTYYWQVAARNSCYTTFSDTNQFTTVGKPDLIVDSLAIPQQSFSGTNITLTYRVKNIGTRSTGSTSWNDYIWLSSDVDLRKGDDNLLIKVPNQTYLDSGQSYVNTVTVQLPQQVLSTQLLFVSADNNDAYCATSGWQCFPGAPRNSHSDGMEELVEPDNNFAFDTLSITPSPLPDVKITNVGAPASAFSGDAITINYDVLNDGGARADIYDMNECFYISTDSIFNQNAVPLQSGQVVVISGSATSSTSSGGSGGTSSSTSVSVVTILPDSTIVLPDSTKARDFKAQLPQNIFGKYYIHIIGDCYDNVFEGFSEGNNNAVRPIDITLTPPADLVVDTAYADDTVQSGGQLPVAFSVINQGSGNPTSWTDSVFLCSTPTFNPDSVLASDDRYYTKPVTSGTISGSGSSGGGSGGGSVGFSTTYLGASGYTLSIPQGISGTYYVFVKADAEDDVFEYQNESNNRSRAIDPVVVELAPPVDLTVKDLQISANDTLYEDSIIKIEYYVHNEGTGKAVAPWIDQVNLRNGPGPNASRSSTIQNYQHSNDLPAGDSVKMTFFYKIPRLQEARYHFTVQTDRDDDVYEHQGEGNNIALSSSFKPQGYYLKQDTSSGANSSGGNNTHVTKSADLQAQQWNVPANGSSGQQLSLTWQGLSNGPDSLLSTAWMDRIYLSQDTIFDGGDIRLKTFGYNQALLPGQAYSRTKSVKLPNGISGSYHLILNLAEDLQNIEDTLPINNVRHQAINVSLTPPVDLIVDQMAIPSGTYYGGQSIWVDFSIKNDAVGSLQNRYVGLTARLASNPTGQGGSNVGFHDTTISLNGGASYSDSVQVQLPGYAVGNYYLVLEVDRSNRIYEHLKEGNNIRAQTLTVQSSANITTDLIPTQISAPDTFWLGKTHQVPYIIENQGTVQASGTAGNGFYFAKNSTFNSATDQLFGISSLPLNLNLGQTQSDQIQAVVQGVAPGSYYGIARMNLNAGVAEFNYSNNDTTLPQQVVVAAESLLPGQLDSNTLVSGDPVYYKIPVSAGKDLLIDLKSASTNTGVNNFYASFNQLPTTAQSDFASTAARLDQQLLVPNTQAGDYYVLATGSNNTLQNISVEATLLPFSILKIAPGVVGKGNVTTDLSGAGFRQGLTVALRNDQGVYVDTAQITQYRNSMELQLEWALSDVDTGYYDVVAINPDQSTAVLNDGLKVEKSTGFQHFMYVNSPSVIRAGKSGFFTFVVKNDGNIDIPYIKGDISVKSYANVTSFQIPNSQKVFYPTKMAGNVANLPQSNVTDWKEVRDAKRLPFVIKDLAPGEQIKINATFKGFISSTFPYRMRSLASTDQLFVQGIESNIEKIRQAAIAGYEDSVKNAQVLSWVYNREAFLDTVINFYLNEGLLELGDTTHLTGTCSTCGNGYDFSPGTSPGRAVYTAVNLGPDQNMLWEINHPNGTPGGELGWDVMESIGSINVNATSANPFKIDLLTLSSWDNQPAFLTTWSPGYDHCWPIMIASGGISGFAKSKFQLNDSAFKNNTPLYGGSFELQLSPNADTLYLCFRAASPGVGQDGFPGGSGHYGQDGGRGGPGGPCGPNTPPGDGGRGGSGGHGIGGWLPPGQGGMGGPGGDCASGNYPGADGGPGGRGGEG